MASFKQIQFYLLLIAGLAISIIAVYIFLSSSIVTSLFNLNNISYLPGVVKQLGTIGSNTKQVTFTQNSHTASINATIADTDAKRQKGLMNVKHLDENSGMLFIFQGNPQIQSFWMKDTLIPLDMIFLDANKQVVYIQKNAPPCTADPCPIYSSQFPAQYVVEANGGWSDRHQVSTGAQVSF